MENDNRRSMGDFNYQGRVKIGISRNTSFFGNKRNSCKCSKSIYFTTGGRKIIRKRCHRTCPFAKQSERFLLYLFPGSQKIGRTQTSNQSKTSQQVSQETTLQNGFTKQSSKPSSERRLGHLSRSKRCISAHSNFSTTQTVSSFLHQRKMLPVHLPLLRTNGGTEGVYKSGLSSGSASKNAKYSSCSVPRRLVFSKSNKEASFNRQREGPQSVFKTRFPDKSGQICSGTKSVSSLYRGKFSIGKRNSVPYSGENNKNQRSLSESERRCNSTGLSSSTRPHGILHRAGSQCSTLHATNTTASASILEASNNVITNENSFHEAIRKSPSVLAKKGKFVERVQFCPSKQFKDNYHRRIQNRIRRSHGKSIISGNLVCARQNEAHQSVRDEGCYVNSPAFSSSTERTHCSNQVRQYYSGAMHQQARQHKISSNVLSNMGFVASSIEKSNNSQGCSSSGQPEHIGRQSEQGKDFTNRMVSKRCSGPQSVSDLGSASSRPICIGNESEDIFFLHMDSQSTGISNGCVVNCLGKHGGICFSANMSHSESHSAHEEFQLPNNSDSTAVAEEALVHQSASNVHSMSDEIANSSRSIDSTENPNMPSQSSDFQAGCMATVNRSLQNKGFSVDTRKLMVASWRAGTRKDYAVKFKKFNSWCSEREIDPYDATVTNCADFLTSLYQDGLKYRTISGYRSMLSVLLPSVEGVQIGQHPDIIRLLKGVFNSRPPVKRLVPEWDLHKVLDMLSKSPFEPMNKISLKYLTWKTVFLAAVSTFRRCGDIQALRIDSGFMSIVQEGIIFIREGLSKQDRPGHSCKKILVPCFRKNTKVDPKRAVESYLKKTADLRQNSGSEVNQLFISINKPHKAVSKQTVSSWIVGVIKLAYEDSEMNVKAHSTRAIGPSWALFKGASITSILEAADWSSDTTFKKFYYRELESQDWEF